MGDCPHVQESAVDRGAFFRLGLFGDIPVDDAGVGVHVWMIGSINLVEKLLPRFFLWINISGIYCGWSHSRSFHKANSLHSYHCPRNY